MNNRKSTWKYNKLLTGRNRYYAFGDFLFNKETSGANKGKVTDRSFGNLSQGAAAAISGIGGAAGSLIGGGLQSGVGSGLSAMGDIAGAIPGPWGAVASAGLKVAGGITNALFGSKMNEENIAEVENNINQLNAFKSDASDFDTLSANWQNAVTGMSFNDSFIGKDGLFSNKAKDKARELRKKIEEGESWVQRSLTNNADNIQNTQMSNLLANYTAFGGELNTQGADFTNGLLHINNGGTHEQNPNEGVLMGIDDQGIPNLVEEGETIFNDYVFSDRLKVPQPFRMKYKLGGNKPLTFAEVSKKLAKESEERPNDPISIKGLQSLMGELMMVQENEKNMKEAQESKKFALGGGMKRYYATAGRLVKSGDKWTAKDREQQAFKDALDFYKKHWDQGAVQDQLKGAGLEYDSFDAFNSAVNSGEIGKRTIALMDLLSNLPEGQSSPIATTTTYKVRTTDDKGNPIVEDLPTEHSYYSGRNSDTGYTWEERFLRSENPIYKEGTTGDIVWENGKPTQTIYFDKVNKPKGSTSTTSEYWYEDPTTKELTKYEGSNPYQDIYAKGDYDSPKEIKDGSGVTKWEYRLKQKQEEPEVLDTRLRYVPAVAQGISAITDAFGLTNKPDYSSVAPLESAVNNLDYRSVKYTPVGNYLTYKPVDTNRYLNQLNATAGAARRSILNTAGGNRGTAMAALLASDNNYMNQIGELGIKAEQENWERRKQVEDFNRQTNITNSQGFMDAAKTNAASYASTQGARLDGISNIAKYKQAILDSSNAVKSSNLSGALTSLGNIGKENMAWNWRNFGMNTGSFGIIGEDQKRYLNGNTNKKGGKIKRRKKGLTY